MIAPKTSFVAAPRCAFVRVQCSEMFMMTSGCRDTETDSAAAPDDEATTEEEEEVAAGAAEDDVAAGAAEGPAEAAAPSSTSMTIPKARRPRTKV